MPSQASDGRTGGIGWGESFGVFRRCTLDVVAYVLFLKDSNGWCWQPWVIPLPQGVLGVLDPGLMFRIERSQMVPWP